MEEHWKYPLPREQDEDGHCQSPRKATWRPRWFVLFAVIVIGGIAWFGSRQLSRPSGQARQDRPNAGETEWGGLLENAPSTTPLSVPDLVDREPRTLGPDPPPETITGLIEEAKQRIGRLVELFPNHPDALELMARVHNYLGNSTEASECWHRCLELNPGSAAACEGLGRVALKRGDYEEAVAHLRKAVTLSPTLSEAACNLADALTKLGKVEEAIAALEKNIQANPESATSFLLLGQIYLQLKDYEKAKESYQAAIQIQPDLSGAHFGLATVLARCGQREEYLECLKTFRRLRTEEAKSRADMRAQVDDLDATSENFSVAYLLGGQIYYASGNLREAERFWRRAATLNPKNAACRTLLASLYLQANRPEDAIRVYEQLAAVQMENPDHHWRLGVLRARLGQLEAAEEDFKKVLELAPENSRGYAGLAELYLHSDERLAEAERLARKAVKLDPTAPHYVLLSRVCAKRGDQAAAISVVDEAIELDPDNTQLRRLQAQLRTPR